MTNKSTGRGVGTEQERVDFEAWCETRHMETGRDNEGDYISLETALSWEAYRAGRAALQSQPLTVDALAQEIRRVNGNNALGAGALAEALMPFLASSLRSRDREDALVQAIQEAIALLGPEAPSCSGCEYEWNHALRVLHAAIDHARRTASKESK